MNRDEAIEKCLVGMAAKHFGQTLRHEATKMVGALEALGVLTFEDDESASPEGGCIEALVVALQNVRRTMAARHDIAAAVFVRDDLLRAGFNIRPNKMAAEPSPPLHGYTTPASDSAASSPMPLTTS